MSRMSRRHSQHNACTSTASTAPPDSPGRRVVAFDHAARTPVVAGSRLPVCAGFAHLG